MKVVVAAGKGCILDAVILQCVLDNESRAHSAGYEKSFLAGLFFTSDPREELI